MARVNVGVNPKYLSDAHLIAESVEITMITGQLKKQKKMSQVPNKFSLAKGHMNFFKNKLLYLKRRLNAVNNEMRRRGFNPGTKIELNLFKGSLLNDWTPSYTDTMLVRERIVERLKSPLKLKNHRYCRNNITNINEFANKLLKSEINKV